jgi:hypothetical protein
MGEIFLYAIAPLLINAVTQGIKKVQAVNLSAHRVILLRTTAGILSFLGTVILATATGTSVDASVIEEFVMTTIGTAVLYGLSQVSYYLLKHGEVV